MRKQQEIQAQKVKQEITADSLVKKEYSSPNRKLDEVLKGDSKSWQSKQLGRKRVRAPTIGNISDLVAPSNADLSYLKEFENYFNSSSSDVKKTDSDSDAAEDMIAQEKKRVEKKLAKELNLLDKSSKKKVYYRPKPIKNELVYRPNLS